MLRVVYMGSGDIGLPSLRFLLDRPGTEVVAVVTQPDRPAGRGQRLRPPATKELALARAVLVLQPARLRDPGVAAEIVALRPDVIVVMAYGQILPRSVLEAPRLACLNLHASLLPRHRGASPIQSAILAGDAQSGITVMHMAEGLDTGDIVLARAIDLAPEETAGSLHDRLAGLAPLALADALAAIETGHAPRRPQDATRATYAGKLGRDQAAIDWTLPAAEIERFVRAMNPWPAAWTTLPLAGGEGIRVKVFRTAVGPAITGAPGSVRDAGREGILVATGAGSLRLLELQSDGGRRMAAADWRRGHPIAPSAP